MNQVLQVLILSAFFLLVFAMGELAYRFLNIKAEYTRKWSHIASGLLALLFPYFLNSLLWVAVICALFVLVLSVSKSAGFLPSIHAIERKTFGSVLFPLAVVMSYAAFTYMNQSLLYYYLPVLTLAISDLAAAIVGKRFPLHRFSALVERKSLGGFLAFTLTALLIYSGAYVLNMPLNLLSVFVLPPLVALVELWSPKGIDNVSIPAAVILGLYMFNP